MCQLQGARCKVLRQSQVKRWTTLIPTQHNKKMIPSGKIQLGASFLSVSSSFTSNSNNNSNSNSNNNTNNTRNTKDNNSKSSSKNITNNHPPAQCAATLFEMHAKTKTVSHHNMSKQNKLKKTHPSSAAPSVYTTIKCKIY